MRLTIGIPTYNRAERLDQQLAWLERELEGHADACEVIISDNASVDATPEVAARWRDRLAANVDVHVHVSARNVGPLANIAYCLNAARGRFVWVIGDDDDIAPGTLAHVLGTLERDPDIAGMALEFLTIGSRPLGPCFGFEETAAIDGREMVRHALARRSWGLAFMTAHVYRAEYVRQALLAWPDGTRNLDFQLFVTAFNASCGRVHVTHEPRVWYVTGDNVYERDPAAAARIVGDKAEALSRLAQLGYGKATLARELVRLRHDVRTTVQSQMAEHPASAARTLVRVAAAAATLLLARTVPVDELGSPHGLAAPAVGC